MEILTTLLDIAVDVLDSFATVSYTHLDVYKRQVVNYMSYEREAV